MILLVMYRVTFDNGFDEVADRNFWRCSTFVYLHVSFIHDRVCILILKFNQIVDLLINVKSSIAKLNVKAVRF